MSLNSWILPGYQFGLRIEGPMSLLCWVADPLLPISLLCYRSWMRWLLERVSRYGTWFSRGPRSKRKRVGICLLYTSDAADDLLCVDLGGRRIIKKKKKKNNTN